MTLGAGACCITRAHMRSLDMSGAIVKHTHTPAVASKRWLRAHSHACVLVRTKHARAQVTTGFISGAAPLWMGLPLLHFWDKFRLDHLMLALSVASVNIFLILVSANAMSMLGYTAGAR
jgi:hypothetical protein